MDDFFDDPDNIIEADDILDPTSPLGLAILASGVVDDDEEDDAAGHCDCRCGCRRQREAPMLSCAPCRLGRHWNPQQAG